MKKLFNEMKLEVIKFYYVCVSLDNLPTKYFSLEEIEEADFLYEEGKAKWDKYKKYKIVKFMFPYI